MSRIIQAFNDLLYFIFGSLFEDDYLSFNNSTDVSMEFSGLVGKAQLYSPDDAFAVGFDEATNVRSMVLPKGVRHDINTPFKTLYIKGTTTTGNVYVLTNNLNEGKSDTELQSEAFTRKR